MKTVFADSHYWIAIAKPGDPWADAAKAAKLSIGDVFIVTTDEVLTEFLAAFQEANICENKRQKWSVRSLKIRM